MICECPSMVSIIGKRLVLVTTSGWQHTYSHIMYLHTTPTTLEVHGETVDVDGIPIMVKEKHPIDHLRVMWMEFYKSPI